jgi:hypothetical protein
MNMANKLDCWSLGVLQFSLMFAGKARGMDGAPESCFTRVDSGLTFKTFDYAGMSCQGQSLTFLAHS